MSMLGQNQAFTIFKARQEQDRAQTLQYQHPNGMLTRKRAWAGALRQMWMCRSITQACWVKIMLTRIISSCKWGYGGEDLGFACAGLSLGWGWFVVDCHLRANAVSAAIYNLLLLLNYGLPRLDFVKSRNDEENYYGLLHVFQSPVMKNLDNDAQKQQTNFTILT